MRPATGVVVAAGRSVRFGGGEPKQYADLGGVPVVARSVGVLASRPRVEGVVVVVPPDDLATERTVALERLPGVLAVVAGGPTRARSVALGLAAADGAGHVLVHDAARPLVSARLVDDVIDATLRHGAAVPVVSVRDTVKVDDGNGFVGRTLDREALRLAQTPQGSRADWLREALDRAERQGVDVTDESQALELAGRRVALVAGETDNLKITGPRDLEEARRRLTPYGGPDVALRVGTGFDVHRLGAGRPLVLGGVLFAGEPGLEGHSDADVVLHAAMDAVLGAAGLDDIGAHFPPDDPTFAGADSRELARDVARLVRASGRSVVNLDLTILAERPKIRPHVGRMRDEIAACFGIEPGRVGIKATTAEGLGAIGRSEGIACHAVALLTGSAR